MSNQQTTLITITNGLRRDPLSSVPTLSLVSCSLNLSDGLSTLSLYTVVVGQGGFPPWGVRPSCPLSRTLPVVYNYGGTDHSPVAQSGPHESCHGVNSHVYDRA